MKYLSTTFDPDSIELIKSSLTILKKHADIAEVSIDKRKNILSINILDSAEAGPLSRDDLRVAIYSLKNDLAKCIEQSRYWRAKLEVDPTDENGQTWAPYWEDRAKEIRGTLARFEDLNEQYSKTHI